MASPRSSSTCSALVGLGRPDVFALGAATKTACRLDQLLRDQITWKPDRNAVKTAGCFSRNDLCFWKNHGSEAPARIFLPEAVPLQEFLTRFWADWTYLQCE